MGSNKAYVPPITRMANRGEITWETLGDNYFLAARNILSLISKFFFKQDLSILRHENNFNLTYLQKVVHYIKIIF